MINLNTFTILATKMYDTAQKNDEYLSSIPRDIRDSFFDNYYVNNIQMQFEFVLNLLIPEPLVDALYIFLYDTLYVGDGNELIGIDEFLAFIAESYFDENGVYINEK